MDIFEVEFDSRDAEIEGRDNFNICVDRTKPQGYNQINDWCSRDTDVAGPSHEPTPRKATKMILDRFLFREPNTTAPAQRAQARRRASSPVANSPRARTHRAFFGGLDRVFGVPISG